LQTPNYGNVLQDNQGYPPIAPVEITVLAQEGKSPEQVTTMRAGSTEVLSRQKIIDPALLLEVAQLSAELPANDTAFPAGSVSMNQG
jgi:hypothetical protein